MTLAAPSLLNPLRTFRAAATVIPLRSTQSTPAQHMLMVEFASPDARTWQAIGGGNTLAAAIAFAQDSCPTDTTWRPISWTEVYGD